MNKYIRLSDSKYPVFEWQIRAAFPNVSFPVPFTPPEGYAAVLPAPNNLVYDPITTAAREGAPVENAGVWTQTWETYALPPEQVAANQAAADAAAQEAADAQDASTALAYPKLAAMLAMTPAEIQTWVDQNVNNQADAKDAIKTLAVAVCVLGRKLKGALSSA